MPSTNRNTAARKALHSCTTALEQLEYFISGNNAWASGIVIGSRLLRLLKGLDIHTCQPVRALSSFTTEAQAAVLAALKVLRALAEDRQPRTIIWATALRSVLLVWWHAVAACSVEDQASRPLRAWERRQGERLCCWKLRQGQAGQHAD
jgi:hypothetical protein